MVNSGSIKIEAKAKEYLLTLQHVKLEMLYFVNGPQCLATYLDSNQFLKSWSSYFGPAALNVGLMHVGLAAHEADLTLAMAMELYQPKRVGRDRR